MPMYLPVDTLLHGGTYKIIRFINSGGFGCTYEAEHIMLAKRVAIKEFFVRDFCNRNEITFEISVGTLSKKEIVEKLRKKFVEEARVLFDMHHPGIVRVIDIFEENGTAYYVMEYIEGTSLQELVREKECLSEEEALDYIRQACEALRYVHDRNRLHLDIKPGNIMIDQAGRVLLIDFGASKHYDEATGENTSTLMGVNTPGYAPPEQVRQSFTTFNPSTDIYALGATLYKLLTGITPPDSISLMMDDTLLTALPDSVSASTARAIEQAMQSKRADRPQSVDEFLALLDTPAQNEFVFASLAEEKTVIDTPQEPPVKVAPVSESYDIEEEPKRSNKKIFIAILFVVLLVGGYLMIPKAKKSDSNKLEIADSTAVLEYSVDYSNAEKLEVEVQPETEAPVEEVGEDKTEVTVYEHETEEFAIPVEMSLDIIKDATNQIKRAKSQEDLDKIAAEVGEKTGRLQKEYPDFVATEEEQKAIEEAVTNFLKVAKEKGIELAAQ